MRIRKQQRDSMQPAFNCGLHLLAAATVVSNHAIAAADDDTVAVVAAAGAAVAVNNLQLQTSGDDDDAVEGIEEEKLCCFGVSEVVKIEGETSSCVSHGGSKRIREQGKWIVVGLDSKKHKDKAELSNKTLRLSSSKTSDSSYLDMRRRRRRRSSSSSVQQQTLQSSWSLPQTTRMECNGGGSSISSSEEKDVQAGTQRNLEQKGLDTNQCAEGQMDSEQVRIHDTILEMSSCPDAFAMDAEPDSKKLKALKQAKIGNFFPHSSHQRSSRKRRASPKTDGDKISGVIPEQTSILSPMHVALQLPAPLSPDHPLNHSKESLLHSVYHVFLQAGKAGLTAREAASRVAERGFPGLHQGGVMGRVQVGKLLRSSPFFMELEEGRFALFSAIIGGNEEALVKTEVEAEAQAEAPKKARQKGRWTGLPPLFKVEVEDIPMDIKVESEESCLEKTVLQQSKSRRKLTQLTQEGVVGLGEQCKRTDGKSWHCPLRARLGYQLCDYHLNKLRTKTTADLPGKPDPTIVVKRQASSGSPPDDSWLVPKKPVWRGHSRCLLATLG